MRSDIKQQTTQTTGVLIIHNDSSLLAETLNSAKHLIDSLVVIDGAYEWVAPFCRMSGEDPEKSNDNLLQLIIDSGIPYTYHTGTWQNETHKRQFSLEAVNTNRVMLIDSDEIYDVDESALQTFWASGMALASLDAPLFLHENVVKWHSGTNSIPRKPVFINLAGQDIKTLLQALWLVLPDDEKGETIDRALISKVPLGTFYHLSMFRTDNNSYRRSRFYNLLSMRMAKRIHLDINKAFSTDAEFTELVGQSNWIAMNNMFNLHRLAAGFPQEKDNQKFVTYEFDSPVYRDIVARAYQNMLADQFDRTNAIIGMPLDIFVGQSVFLDFTGHLGQEQRTLIVKIEPKAFLRLIWHVDCGTIRYECNAGNGDLPNCHQYPDMKRLIAEISVHKPDTFVTSVTILID